MDSSLLTHLLALVERTGDRLIVVDPASQKPVVLMGLAQYESLLGHALAPRAPFRSFRAEEGSSDAGRGEVGDQDALAPRAPFRSFRAEEGSPDAGWGEVGDLARGSQRGSFVDAGGSAGVTPGIDPVALRGNAELAAWRASTPADVAPPGPVVLPPSTPTIERFSVEPLQSATHADDQFYVEPIE